MVKEKLTFRKILERFSYGCGDFGCNIIYTAMSVYLMFYYTDYAGVSSAAVGVIMLISRVFDGVSDIIMGVIVDRTKSRFGKARPWLLRMCIPFAVSGVLLFSVPTGWSSGAKLVYVFVTYNLVSTVVYTAINVPYSALNALMTKAVVVLGAVSVAAFLINFFGTEERVRPAVKDGEAKDVPFATGVKALFQNKYWIMMTGMLALFFLMYSVNGGATVFYAKDILGDKNLVTTINGIFNVVQIVSMFFIAMLVKRFGKRNVFALGLVFDIVGMLVLNYSGGAMNLIVVSSVIRGIGNACGGATMWAMVSDTIDYGEWKTGYRTEGLVNSACSFGYKIGNGIGSALLGLILEIGGYVGEAAVQTAEALFSIEVCFVWIPIVVYVCGLIIMKFWHLDKEFSGILADLEKRKMEGN